MTILRVLVAEDNLDIAENIGDYLELKGHHVDYAYDGDMAVHLFDSEVFDVIVMDILMPKLDGLQATKKIRTLANGDIPILMLTAKDTLTNKLTGFASGADDYIVKPFDIEELYARILAHSRRSNKSYHHKLTVDGIELDKNLLSGKIHQQPLALNPTTFKIMWRLLKSYPGLVTKQELEFAVWQDTKPDNDILRSHIYNLRQALAKCSDQVKIVGRHGQGYVLEHIKEK